MNKITKLELIKDENWTPTEKNVRYLIDKLKSNDDNGDWDYDGTEFDLGGGWIYKCEERFGGHEGAGETHYIVFSLTKEKVVSYWQIDGYYMSYQGSELDSEPYQVKQEEKTILVWNKI